MKFFLIVTKGRRQGLAIAITVDLFMIGSGKECQLRCKDPNIPLRLCALVTRGRKVFVRDLNSGWPVLVNGAPLPPGEEWPLHKGDYLEVGPLQFLLEFREKPLSRRDLEEWALGCLDQAATQEYIPADDPVDAYADLAPLTPGHAAAAILDRLASVRGEVVGRLRIGYDHGATVVRFNDRQLVEPAELALVRKELQENLHRPNQRVLLDCKNVQRLSSAAAALLGNFACWLAARGSSLALCRVRPELTETLQRLDLHSRLPIFADKTAALSARW